MRQTLDKVSTKFLRIVPLLLSLIAPLFFLPFTADYFAFNKYFAIAILATLSLIAWCIRNLTRGKIHFTTSPATAPLAILVLANIASSIWLSPTQQTSLIGQTSLFFFLAIIFITVTSSQKNSFVIKSSIYGLIFSASALSIFSLLQYFGILAKIFPFEIFKDRFLNPTGSSIPALTFTLPILVATIFFTTGVKNWIGKSVLFASVLLMIVGTVINISLVLPQNGQVVFPILPFRAGWSIAIDTMKSWPTALLGTGPDTFLSAFTRLRPAYLNLNNNVWTIRFSESSNYFFTLLTTTGLIGALAFLLSFLKPLLVSIKGKGSVEDKNSLNFLLVALASVIVSFFVIPVGIVSIALSIILLTALTIAQKIEGFKSTKDLTFSLSADSQSAPAYRDLSGSNKTSVTYSFLPWLTTFLSVAVLSVFWFFGSKVYLASVYYKQAVDLSQTDAYNSYLKYQKAAQEDVYNPYYPQKLSQIFLSISTVYLTKENPTDQDTQSGTDFAQRAIDAGKISAQIDPSNVNAWENLFIVYRALIPYANGSADLAVSHALQAASIDPTNPAIYLQLGTLFYNLGDVDQGVKFINRANELKTNWDLPYYNLSSIYKGKKDYVRALQYIKAGLQYTDPKSESLTTVQEEIKALEALAPAPAATQSAVPVSPPQQ